MIKYLLSLTLCLCSSLASAEICRVEFTHSYQREDGTLMQAQEFFHEIWLNDGTAPILKTYMGDATRFLWAADTCPTCQQLKVRTGDTKGLYSVWVTPICNPPTQLILCL